MTLGRKFVALPFDETIRRNVDQSCLTGAVFTEWRKRLIMFADRHGLLLDKLSNLGVGDREFKWFKDYLWDPTQVVVFQGASSDPEGVAVGVLPRVKPRSALVYPTRKWPSKCMKNHWSDWLRSSNCVRSNGLTAILILFKTHSCKLVPYWTHALGFDYLNKFRWAGNGFDLRAIYIHIYFILFQSCLHFLLRNAQL